MASKDIDTLCVDTIRVFAADIVSKANSGHPGAPIGMAPMAHLLWSKYMKFNPSNPLWFNRDRFVLSNGHACALQYTMLHLSGYSEYTLDELKRFRQVDSKCPGHPENYITKGGIEVTTGPLGQGFANAVGLAISEKHLAATFNKPDATVVNNRVWVFTGDGCLQEGVSCEAASIAGHLGLNNLIVLYDDNHITIDGNTDLSFSEDVNKRFEAYGWKTFTVHNGDRDLKEISDAIDQALKVTDQPVLIKVRTTIGLGSKVQNSYKVHGSPLTDDDLAGVKTFYGFDPKQFFAIPDQVRAHYAKFAERGVQWESEWNKHFQEYKNKYPELAAELERRIQGKLPTDWKKSLPTFKPSDAAKATRQHGQTVINALAKILPELMGGSADLNPSTLTYLDCSTDFQKKTPQGRNIRFGVREHGMAAICNGMAAYSGALNHNNSNNNTSKDQSHHDKSTGHHNATASALIPYCSTFLNFIGYALGAVRLSAISHMRVIYVMTHDSIGLGEDGPTHQPIESLAIVRSMPNINLIRPADGNETSGAWASAIENTFTPSVICLSRQSLPNLPNTSIEGVSKGAYVIHDPTEGKPQIILVGSGSEVHLCTGAVPLLKDLRVRVVSMPCWEFFTRQSIEYQLSVFPEGIPVMAVEAAISIGWREFAHATVGMTTFGASGPLKEVLNKFGFNAENVAKRAQEVVGYYSKHTCASLIARPF